MSLFHELKRRKVFRVAAVYAATAFAVLEASDLIVGALGVPSWVLTAAVILAIVGFPIALAVGWVYELSSDGIQRTGDAPDGVTADAGESPALLGSKTLALVSVLLVLGIGMGAGWFLRAPVTRAAADDDEATVDTDVAPLIAVLPFANSSSDPDNEYLGDGIAEELIVALGRVPGIDVSPRSSTWQFKGSNLAARQVADSIGATSVLAGSVRRSGDDVRITAELVSADGNQLWSRQYEVTVSDLFATQDLISRSIADALQVRFTTDAEAPTEIRTEQPEAYDHYLLGRYNLALRDTASLRTAVGNFEDAIAIDSTFALAWSGLGLAHTLGAAFGYWGTMTELYVNARTGLDRAIELAPNRAEPHAALGFLFFFARRFEEAEAELMRARQLDPDHTPAIQWLAQVRAALGQETEAISLIEEALRREPFSRGVVTAAHSTNWQLGRWDVADSYAARLVELGFPFMGHAMSFAASMSAGRVDDAEIAMQALTELSPLPPEQQAVAGQVMAQAFATVREARGTGAAVQLAPEFVAQSAWLAVMSLYLAGGAIDEGLDILERGIEADDPLSFAASMNALQTLPDHPRVIELTDALRAKFEALDP